MAVLLTIAGFDPSSGAGVTADLAVAAAHGIFATAAITTLTVQSTVGVRSNHAVAAGLLRETLEMLDEDLPADGIKIGALGSAECVHVVADFLAGLRDGGRRPVVVLDPVLRSTSGGELLNEAGVAAMRERLLALVDWSLPNVGELGVLRGRAYARQPDKERVVEEAVAFLARYPELGLIVTGGDRDPPEDLLVFSGGGDVVWLGGERVRTSATHGTGCAFSTAFSCRLVLGDEPLAAAKAAKEYVREAMRRAVPRGKGHGPMHLMWPLRRGE